jgi:excisionase family DNA binding protein
MKLLFSALELLCATLRVQGEQFVINKLLYSKKEAALSLGISLRSVEHLISQKHLSTRRIGRRVLVSASVLEQFARRDHPEPLVKSDRPSDHLAIRDKQ